MSSNLSIEQLQSATVIDQDGDKIGDVGQVYVDDASGDPSWVTVRTGLFGTKETFIPLDRAENDANGVRVPYEKKFVKDAPSMDEDEHLSPEQEAELYRYYGLDAGTGAGTDAGRTGTDTDTTGRDSGRGVGTGSAGAGYTEVDRGTTGTAAAGLGTGADRSGDDYTDVDRDGTLGADSRGTTGVDEDVVGTSSGYSADLRDPDTASTGTTARETTAAGTGGYGETTAADTGGDEEIVRREERLKVGTETRETGRLRLRKHVVTENQTVTVPVEREEVTIEREPIADGQSHAGGTIGEDEERTISVREEVPVVEKEVVDAERINVHRNTVQDDQAVSGEVRREEVEIDEDGTSTGRTGVDADRERRDTDRL